MNTVADSSSTNSSQSSAIKSLLWASWDATSGERARFFSFVILFTLAYTLDLLTPWAIGYILGIFVTQGFTEVAFQQACWGLSVFVGLKFLHIFFHHYARYQQIRVAYSARMQALNKIFSALVDYPLSWHVRHHSGDSLSKLHRSAGAIEGCIGTYVWQVIEGVVKTVFAGIAIITLDSLVAFNVLLMSAVSVGLMILFNKRLVNRIRKNNAFNDKVNRLLVDQFFNIVTVKTLNLERHAKHSIEKQKAEGARYIGKIAKYGELKWGSVGIGYSLVIGSSLLIYFYTHTFPTKAFDIAQVYVLLNYLDRVFQAIGSFTGYYSAIIEASTAYEDASRILDGQKSIVPPSSVSPLPNDWQRLEIKDLCYSYGRDQSGGVKNISLALKTGEKIALVGPSGGGKSTFLKILAGMLESEHGVLTVDGKLEAPISSVSKETLLIPQEPEIFADSFRYNITIDESFPEKELENFVRVGRLEQLLGQLKDGWNTNLAEKGLNLSVGQKQRVALIRGLLRAKNRKFILLDEPTSSLDPLTEKQIFLEIIQHFSDRTVITACHRLNIVPLFDRVLYIHEGRLLEDGKFDELIKRGGPFAIAWEDYQRNVKQNTGTLSSAV